jgi:hypothetical protein
MKKVLSDMAFIQDLTYICINVNQKNDRTYKIPWGIIEKVGVVPYEIGLLSTSKILHD